jgi:hypothetical protein
MAIYDGYRNNYSFDTVDFGGAGNTLLYLLGPKGKEGFLWDYGVYGLTEAFAGATTTPKMQIGIVGTAGAYSGSTAFDFGALAIAGGTKSIRTTYAPTDAGFATYMAAPNITKDVVIMMTCVAATGAGLTGMATPFVDIIWQD